MFSRKTPAPDPFSDGLMDLPEEYLQGAEITALPPEGSSGGPVTSRKKTTAAAVMAVMSLALLSTSLSDDARKTVRPVAEVVSGAEYSDTVSLISESSTWSDDAGNRMYLTSSGGWLIYGDEVFMLGALSESDDGNACAEMYGRRVDLNPGTYTSHVTLSLLEISGDPDADILTVRSESVNTELVPSDGTELSSLIKLTGMSTADMVSRTGLWKPSSRGPYSEIATLSDGTGYIQYGDRRLALTWEMVEDNPMELRLLSSGWGFDGEQVTSSGQYSLMCILYFSTDGINMAVTSITRERGYRSFVPKDR